MLSLPETEAMRAGQFGLAINEIAGLTWAVLGAIDLGHELSCVALAILVGMRKDRAEVPCKRYAVQLASDCGQNLQPEWFGEMAEWLKAAVC